MLTLILCYLGGVLTILSPCVLPVVPFIFSRSDQPFRRSGLPTLIGMGLSFATFAALSVAGGRWVIQANQIGRFLALIIFAILGLSLIFPQLAERLTRPFVRLGGALQQKASGKSGIGPSLIIGASVGLLWAPCAGPILGLVLAGAAIGESNHKTFALLLVFAMGAATSLGVAIFAGGKVLRTLKKGFAAEEWIRRALGFAVLCAVVAITLGLDTKILAKISYSSTNEIEQSLVQHFSGKISSDGNSAASEEPLADEGAAPSLTGATDWLNSPAVSIESLRGKVVLIDFWTYSCINCLRTLPYLKAWAEKYRDQGLIVVGIHTPEFAFEKDLANVKSAIRDLEISYPVAIDNDQRIWAAYKNQYWPAHYFIDTKGRIRHHHFGEGSYEESERVIQELLQEAQGKKLGQRQNSSSAAHLVVGTGIEAPPSEQIASPETYLGYERQEGFSSIPEIKKEIAQTYREPSHYGLNQWGLSGLWKIGRESASLQSSQGTLEFRFRARDVHLVIGNQNGKTIRFQVSLDGNTPGSSHGEDTDEAGDGIVKSHRLYQLIRQKETPVDHTISIKFLDPGAEVFAFTFG